MSLFEEAVALATHLPQEQREQLAKALGVEIKQSPKSTLPMANASAPLDAAAWRKVESGHAVLATDAHLRDDQIPEGAAAISGMWRAAAVEFAAKSTFNAAAPQSLPAGIPVVVHHDVNVALACGDEHIAQFYQNPPVEVRLATAGYLHLLSLCQSPSEQQRVRRFVQPFAVLSLGPMASSLAVELMLKHQLHTQLQSLDALTAATALAHEIPLLTRRPERFAGIADLAVVGI